LRKPSKKAKVRGGGDNVEGGRADGKGRSNSILGTGGVKSRLIHWDSVRGGSQLMRRREGKQTGREGIFRKKNPDFLPQKKKGNW